MATTDAFDTSAARARIPSYDTRLRACLNGLHQLSDVCRTANEVVAIVSPDLDLRPSESEKLSQLISVIFTVLLGRLGSDYSSRFDTNVRSAPAVLGQVRKADDVSQIGEISQAPPRLVTLGLPSISERNDDPDGRKEIVSPPSASRRREPPVAFSESLLRRSGNAWSTRARGGNPTRDSAELVERKVKGLLNKLTMERFDTISDQIIEWANKSEKEKDGRTLIQVIRLVFEKATDEAMWSHKYARLCRKMMEQISDGVMDEGIRNADGNPIKGGLLFRKYLLNRCQEDFERGWSVQAQTAATAAKAKAEDDAAKKKSNDTAQAGEEELYSDEYYAAQKARRRGLGLVRFFGELFKLQMLTERIMHECIKKLLSNVDNPGEEEIESICKLLATVGQALDTSKARSHMDIYFKRMRDLSDSPNIDSRLRGIVQDLIELRERRWRPDPGLVPSEVNGATRRFP